MKLHHLGVSPKNSSRRTIGKIAFSTKNCFSPLRFTPIIPGAAAAAITTLCRQMKKKIWTTFSTVETPLRYFRTCRKLRKIAEKCGNARNNSPVFYVRSFWVSFSPLSNLSIETGDMIPRLSHFPRRSHFSPIGFRGFPSHSPSFLQISPHDVAPPTFLRLHSLIQAPSTIGLGVGGCVTLCGVNKYVDIYHPGKWQPS